MRIRYKITINPEIKTISDLKKYELDLIEGFQVIYIDKSHNYFEQIFNYLKNINISLVPETKFTSKEISEASFANIYSKYFLGYPQPEDEYEDLVYENIECNECKVIKQNQIKPFSLSKTPKLNMKKKSFQLFWVNDEIFFEKEFYDRFLKKLGVKSMPVMNIKNNLEIDNIVQLYLPESSSFLDDTKIDFIECPKCDTKYSNPIPNEGFFPSFKEEVNYPIFKTKEFFGSGEYYSRRIIINKEVKNLFIENKINIEYLPTK